MFDVLIYIMRAYIAYHNMVSIDECHIQYTTKQRKTKITRQA